MGVLAADDVIVILVLEDSEGLTVLDNEGLAEADVMGLSLPETVQEAKTVEDDEKDGVTEDVEDLVEL